jgi:hypothetical protein
LTSRLNIPDESFVNESSTKETVTLQVLECKNDYISQKSWVSISGGLPTNNKIDLEVVYQTRLNKKLNKK